MSSSPRPKVMFVTSIQTAGGGEAVLFEVASELPIEAVVAAPDGDVLDELRSRGVPVRRLAGPAELHRASNRMWFLELTYRALISWIEIAWMIRGERPDIVHVNNLAAGIYALPPAALLRKPRLWHIHDVVKAGSIEAGLVRRLQRTATRIIVPSHASRAALIAIGVPEERITILHSGIDARHRFNPDDQAPTVLRQELGISPDATVVAAIGHIAPGKGIHVLLDAIDELVKKRPEENIHLILVGSAPPSAIAYEHQLRDRVKQHGDLHDRTHFVGSRSDVPALFLDVDILVQPSIYPESFGRSVVEAMAMKKVVVASRAGALSELVDDGVTGYLFETGSAHDLATKLSQAMDNTTGSALTAAARERVLNHYDTESRDALLVEIYADLAQSKRL